MRFILKSAFWLGLVAFLLPGSGSGEAADPSAEISWFTALVGAEQALQDVTGFCDRAPAACEAGREFAAFAGERIGEGVVLAYQLVEGPITEAAAPAATDPILTAGIGATAPETAPAITSDEEIFTAPVPPLADAPAHAAAVVAVPPHAAAAAAPGPFRAPVPTPSPRA